MGVQGHSGSERSRTIWTQEMDRYFIHLMLEQVRRGNKIDDHLFSKRAWKHMTSLFNTKFRFQYEKDVLKNRHKTMRNLYKAITNLLQQKGFSWDETRQMVTADNKIWDDYIKVHPDARSYRIKTIPYYNDLCEINKNAITEWEGNSSSQHGRVNNNITGSEMDGLQEGLAYPASSFDVLTDDRLIESSSHSGIATLPDEYINETALEALHEIEFNEDYAVSLLKDTTDQVPQPALDMGERTGTRLRTYWQPPMDRYFIDLMLDHVQKGNQIDGLFHKQAWMKMLASFNAKFGFIYDVEILKNRYKTLRRQYNAIKSLLELDGFVWDDTRQMVTADDCVWQDYIKAHSTARQYMTRPVPYYKDLCLICREINADEKENFSGHEIHQQEEFQGVRYNKLLNASESPETSFSCDDLIGDVQESSHVANKRQLDNPSSSSQSKKARNEDEGMVNALHGMATAVSALVDKRKKDDDSVPIEIVIGAIQALPDMDDELVLDACDFLEDEKKAKTFLALDIKLRKKWLTRKLRPQQQCDVSHGQLNDFK